jgi:hypothetical protein
MAQLLAHPMNLAQDGIIFAPQWWSRVDDFLMRCHIHVVMVAHL